MIVAAIDPGANGAIACIDDATGVGWAEPMDTTDGAALADHFRANIGTTNGTYRLVAVEVPTGRPPKTGGWRQISQQWRAIGCAEGVVLALGLPLVRVRPQDWQRVAFAGHAKPDSYAERKCLSLRLARERWPGAHLDRVKDSGLAEALWIAYVAGHSARQEEHAA
jgi:hypothetical protein